MVATTPVYDLPYQEGSDPPCFGPGTGCDNLESVWCDFAALVEAQLDENDAVIGRTADAIPMARILISDPLGVGISWEVPGEIPFDTVVFDTDDMVNLSQKPGISPRRNGVYRIDYSGLFFVPAAVFDDFQIRVSIGSDFTIEADAIAVTPGGGSFNLRSSTLYAFTNIAPFPRVITAEGIGTTFTGATLINSSLTAYWHSDL